MSDEELAGKTAIFKERLAKGETLDDILVEAFATAREVAYRQIGETISSSINWWYGYSLW